MNRRTAIRWWTLTGLLVAVIAWADYVGVMADEDTGTVALSPLEARIANWNAITGTPTTVAGYGITDGATESWVIDYVVANTTPIDMTNEPAFIGWTNIWHDLITNHLADTTSNPHGITPEMIGAASDSEVVKYIIADNTTNSPDAHGAVNLGNLSTLGTSISNFNWQIITSSEAMSFQYNGSNMLTMTYGETDAPKVTSISASTNPPTLVIVFESIGTSNRLETTVASNSPVWSTWNDCTWEYADGIGTVTATNVDMDTPTWARIVSLSGIVNTNPYIHVKVPMYIGPETNEGARAATRAELIAVDNARATKTTTASLVPLEQDSIEPISIILTNTETGVVTTNANITPGDTFLAWLFDKAHGRAFIHSLSVSNLVIGNKTFPIAIVVGTITNHADAQGIVNLGDIAGANTDVVTGRQIIVGSELNVTPDYGYAIGKRSGVTANNGIALGYRASVTSQNSFVWSDASSDTAFNSQGSNTFSVRATGGILLNGPMAGPLNMGGNAATNLDTIVSTEGVSLSIDDNSVYFSGIEAIHYSSGTNVWQGRVNDTEASRIAALAEVNAGSIVGATVSVGSQLAVTTNAGVLAFTVPAGGAGGGNLTATNTPTSGQMLYASGTDNDTLYWDAAPEGGGTATTNAFAGLPSILVSADWTWTNAIYAVGADTSSTNIAITLPDAGTNFTSIVIRKFSNLNQLFVKRGTNTVYTLNDDGSARAYDWWPQRTNWYWRN